MKINNKDLIQSYILTCAKYDFSITEKRILYRIVESMQTLLKGQKLLNKVSINESLLGDYRVTMPAKLFLKDDDVDDKNYAEVRKALSSLRHKVIEYEDAKIWKPMGIIELPVYEKYSMFASFTIHKEVYDALLDFSKGYSKYELKTAMSFNGVYSMRFYELLSSQIRPITYSIKNLQVMFQLENKYKNDVNGFIKRVIKTAKKELDAKSPKTFEYKINKIGRSYASITFYPVYQPQYRDPELEKSNLQKNISLRFDLDKLTIDYLKQNYMFSEQEIKNNIELFLSAYKNPNFDLLGFLSAQKRNASEKKNPKGWLINSIKKQLEQLGSYDVNSLINNIAKSKK